MENRTLAHISPNQVIREKKQVISLKQGQLKTQQNKENISQKFYPFQSHQAFKYLRGTYPSEAQFKAFANMLYKGIKFGINTLKAPSQDWVRQRKVKLVEPVNSRNKILFMDLDETLIHSEFTGMNNFNQTEVQFDVNRVNYHFNIRPYCLEFLDKMSQYFNIYVFTAGEEKYANVIVNYLNKSKMTINGVLSQKYCLKTSQGYYVKDLRIIQNQDLKDIVIVDNLVQNFGLQIQNGIPILEFTDQKNDVQFKGLQSFLIQLSRVDDVRVFLKERLELRKIIQFPQNQYLHFESKLSS